MKLPKLAPRKIAEMAARTQAQRLVMSISLDDLHDIWPSAGMEVVSDWLADNGCEGYFEYTNRNTVAVFAHHLDRDGFSEKQLAVEFAARYAGGEADLALDPLTAMHSVWYWVGADGSLTFAADGGLMFPMDGIERGQDIGVAILELASFCPAISVPE